MSDNPKCKTCGTEKVIMVNGKGTHYVGCPSCKPGKKPDAKPPASTGGDPAPKPPAKEGKHWTDDCKLLS